MPALSLGFGDPGAMLLWYNDRIQTESRMTYVETQQTGRCCLPARKMKYLLCALLLLSTTVHALSIVDPADPNILYTGRWDSSTAAAPWSYWIGSSIIVHFEGTSIAGRFSAGWGSSPDYLRIIVDGDAAGSTKIAVGTSEATYILATGLADTLHQVEIIKETDQWRWTLFRFELDDGKSLAPPPPRPLRKIMFYGDSNLAGYSLEDEKNQSGYHLRGSYRGLSGITARMFDAEYQNVSMSGATISDIHGVFGRVDYWYAAPQWDFADFVPQVVVVNLGANDVGSPKVQIKNDYHAFLDTLRAVHPLAHIVLYNGWGWDYDEPANYTHEVVSERSDPELSSTTFPWLFEQWHGCEYDHAGMAGLLAEHLTSMVGWTPGLSDVMNGYGRNGNVANGGFEEVAPFGGYGWRYFTDPGVSRVHAPGGAHEGSYYLRLENGAESHQPIPATDGEAFTVTVWMRGDQNGDEADITVDFRDQEMWTSPLQTETERKSLSTDWQSYSMNVTAPSGLPLPVFQTRVTFKASPGSAVDIDGVVLSPATGVGAADLPPAPYHFSTNPNPFNPSARIEFRIPGAADVFLWVHDISGRRVATLAEGHHQGGAFETTWDGLDDSGREVGSGVYFARMESGRFAATRKMVLIR